MFGRRIGDVQLFQRQEMPVDRGDQAGVERAEQPGPLAGSADRKTASPVAYAMSMSRASWPVTTAVVSSSPAIAFPCRAADRMPRMPMAATAATMSVTRYQRHEQDGRSLNKSRIHLTYPASQS